MTHVEQTDTFANGTVLLDDTRVTHRHLEAGKCDHAGTQGYVHVVQRGSLEFGHYRNSVFNGYNVSDDQA
jgi:hypothetical protein